MTEPLPEPEDVSGRDACPNYKAAHEALAIEEILDRIVAFADDASNASIARVCRDWFECAVKTLWKTIHVTHAIRLLAPFSYSSVGNSIGPEKYNVSFSRALTPSDWTRFSIYATHVRILNYNAGFGVAEVVSAMALSRPQFHIFPGLKKIFWNALDIRGLAASTLFMSQSVTFFYFRVVDIGPKTQVFDAFCQEVHSRLPNLTFLFVESNIATSIISRSLIKIIEHSKYLEVYRTQWYGVTPEILYALSRLPRLRQVDNPIKRLYPSPAHIADVETIDPNGLKDGAFPSVTVLHFSTNLHQIRGLVESPRWPRSLNALICNALHHETPGEVRALMTSIAAACLHLKVLLLVCVPFKDAELEVPMVCSWESLRPILQCRSLKHLVFHHILPLEITDTDIEELSCDRDTWTDIQLSPFPTRNPSHTPTLGLSSILPFLRHCPHLKTLGLHLDGDKPLPIITAESSSRSLEELVLGTSPVSVRNTEEIAMFLAGACLKPIKIVTEWKNSPAVAVTDPEFKTRAAVWKGIETLQNKICNVARVREAAERRWK